MIRSIINLVRAFIQWAWRTVSHPWIRNTIAGLIIAIALIILIISGYSFSIVYSGIIGFLIIFGALSFWITPLRGFLVAILVAGALLYFGKEIVFEKIVPSVDSYISKNYSNFPGWKKSRKELIDNRLEEDTVLAKKEIMQSEAIQGTFGEMKENSPAYDENGDVISDLFLKKGQKVMSLGTESRKQNDESEGMAYVRISNEYGHFVKSPKALVPIRIIEWESGKKETPQKPSASTSWEKVEEKVVDFSQLEALVLGQDQCIVEIKLPLKKLDSENYRVKISGMYDFFLSDNTWTSFPWKGSDRLSGNPGNKPYKDLQYGAIVLLDNGAVITPVTDEGVTINPSASSKFLLRINAFTRNPAEWYSAKIGRMILKNSTAKPLTIIVEKAVKG